jgi:hypothetical protein
MVVWHVFSLCHVCDAPEQSLLELFLSDWPLPCSLPADQVRHGQAGGRVRRATAAPARHDAGKSTKTQVAATRL